LPIKLVKPKILQNIFKKVTLHIPEGYELMFETGTENVHIFYKLAILSLVEDAHSIKSIVTIPLKTTNSYFDLYSLVILPQPIASNKHFRYSIYYTYFSIQRSKRDYLLFRETDYNRCYRGSVTICPSKVRILVHKLKRAR
jgi:hypothetical protein